MARRKKGERDTDNGERDPLARLMRQADAVGETAEKAIKDSMRDIQARIALLTRETNVGGSAAAREAVFAAASAEIAKLRKRLAKLTDAQTEYAAKAGFKAGNILGTAAGGLDVHYSKKRADEMCALVTGEQGKNLAAVFTDNMEQHVIDALRSATVSAMREQAVSGGTQKDLGRLLEAKWLQAAKNGENFQFVDAADRVWNTKTYVAMNVRTNAMRVYNDTLLDTIAQSTGSDLVRVSSGGDPDCRLCFPWEGRILSISGKTKEFPSYEQAKEAGLFHPNCQHTLGTVHEILNEDEIELQRRFPMPINDDGSIDPDTADENRYEIDKARYVKKGMTPEQARVAVDRDNLTRNLQAGLVREDAKAFVAKMTDEQVTALCKNGNPPAFEPTKKATKSDPHAADEIWRKGSRGGVVHIDRNTTVENLLKVCGVDKPPTPPAKPWTPTTALEKSTDAQMQGLGITHTDKPLDISGTNPNYAKDKNYQINCQRCVPAYEARLRGYDVEAKPCDGNYDGVRFWKDSLSRTMCKGGKGFRPDFEGRTTSDPVGSRYLLRIRWKNTRNSAHFFMARKTDKGMVYENPQNPSANAEGFFTRAARVGNWYLRVDNREFTKDLSDCITPVKH